VAAVRTTTSMTAKKSLPASASLALLRSDLPDVLKEGARYFGASVVALAIDAALYSALIRLLGVHYLVAAPAGFAVGVVVVYALSTRWVFPERRLKDPGSEFAIFVFVGMAGMLINQISIYLFVERLDMFYEAAKLSAAVATFGFNFVGRKLLLFTRFGN
jgi:putative flippase GtrA